MRKILLVVLLIYSGTLFATERVEYYFTRHITSEQGLPHSLVFDIEQSNDGFLWVATNNGLGRFDGYTFKTFRPQTNKPNYITSKSITHLYIDKQRHLWLSMQGIGLNRMDIDDETFYGYFPSDSLANSISGNDVYCHLQTNDSILWLGTNNGLNKFDPTTKQISLCLATITNELSISHIFEDKNNNLWLSANNQIWYYNPEADSLQSLSQLTKQPLLKDFKLNNSIFIDQSLCLFGTEEKGLIAYNVLSDSIEYQTTEINSINNIYISPTGDLYAVSFQPDAHIYCFPDFKKGKRKIVSIMGFENKPIPYYVSYTCDAQNNVWLTTGEGLYKIYPDYTISLIKSKNDFGNKILGKTIYVEHIDKMNNLWLRSERNGIVMIDLNQKQFKTYDNFQNINPIISGSNISLVFNDSKGNIWVGCHSKGVSCYNPKSNSFINYEYDSNDSTKLIYRAPAGIAEDKDGYIWIGFYDGYMVKINPKNQQVEQFSESESGKRYFEGNSIRKIITDFDGNLWFATNTRGLIEYKFKSQEFVYHSVKHESNFLNNSHYRYLMQTSDGILWTGTQNGGLGRYDKNNNEFIHYINKANDKYSISGNTVYYIFEENDSLLWVGTDKGLNSFNRKTNKFKNYQITANNFICAIYRIYNDSENNLWLSGDCGLIKFNKHTKQATIYNKSDGLPGNEFNTTAGCKAADGNIYLGSSSGLVSFNPKQIGTNPYEAKPILTQLKIFNKAISPGDKIKNTLILEKELSLIKKLELPHYLNDFTIEFSSMHFASPLKNKYKYKLVGYNSEWIKTDANRRWANFTGLEPGVYNFHLKASNNDGLMCKPEDEISLEIIIKPPFSETWAFRIMLISLLIFIGYTMSRLRLKNIKTQKNKLENTVIKRTKELKDQNELLEERQEEITQQKTELVKHRNHLEELVKARTIDLENALKQAEESDRLKSAFLSNMSHEIRTPMNAILGFSSLLREPNLDDSEKEKFLDTIHINGETLLNLLNDIIDISIIESNQIKIVKKETNIAELIEEVVLTFTRSHKFIVNQDIELKYNITDIIFNTDAGRLKQILNNLISNAIKYTKKGEINVNCQASDSGLLFSVSDTGIGIEKGKINFIFDRFNKIEDMSDATYRGGGLGLAICKNLVELLGGKIWVESEPCIGSTFYFNINNI